MVSALWKSPFKNIFCYASRSRSGRLFVLVFELTLLFILQEQIYLPDEQLSFLVALIEALAQPSSAHITPKLTSLYCVPHSTVTLQ